MQPLLKTDMFAHAQAPCRIGIAGGGTDLPAWTKTGRVGRCLSLAIATHVHVVAISRADRKVVAVYRDARDEDACATEIANGLVRETALLHGFEEGFEVHLLSEITSRGSGLGVSSSFAVALAACFRRMRSLPILGAELSSRKCIDVMPNDVATDAWTVEIDRLRRPIGRQDHMAAAHGGLRLYRFEGENATVERTFSEEDARWVASRLTLLPLPDGHDARQILSGAKDVSALDISLEAVDVAVQAIEERDAGGLGRALAMGQASKCSIPGAVTEEIAKIAERAASCPGVRGVKVCGAGGGGHLAVAVDRDVGEWRANLMLKTGLPVLPVAPDFVGVRSEGWA